MTQRSLRPDVRNPLLLMPAISRLRSLPPETRALFAELMGEISADARSRAQESWRRNKGPMAAYWKAVGVYAFHIKRALRAEVQSS